MTTGDGGLAWQTKLNYLKNEKTEKVKIGQTSKLLEQVNRYKSKHIIFGCFYVVILKGQEKKEGVRKCILIQLVKLGVWHP